MREHLQKYLAEFIGTLALVFIGCGACIAHHEHADDITHVGVALAFGGVVMCAVYGVGRISGAHINPAVTIGFWFAGRFPRNQILPYLGAQFLGAVSASALHIITYGDAAARSAQFGATIPAEVGGLGGTGMEFILTFFLMFVIMAVATDARAVPGIAGLAIGGVVTFDCLAAGKCCGASMNPARSFGPALFAGGEAMRTLWVYFVGPILGAIIAARTYEYVRGPEQRVGSVPVFADQPCEAMDRTGQMKGREMPIGKGEQSA